MVATQTYSPSMLKDGMTRLANAFLARHLNSKSFSVIQPERIQALYYPSWCVDAEVEAKVWFSADLNDPCEVSKHICSCVASLLSLARRRLQCISNMRRFNVVSSRLAFMSVVSCDRELPGRNRCCAIHSVPNCLQASVYIWRAYPFVMKT